MILLLSGDYHELVSGDVHRELSQAHVRQGEAAAGGDVELERVPGAGNDLLVVEPREPVAGMGSIVECAGDRTGAQGSALMGTEIRDRVPGAFDVEDPDLAVTYPDDVVGVLGEVLGSSEDVLLSHGR